jgi:hypothetical protein
MISTYDKKEVLRSLIATGTQIREDEGLYIYYEVRNGGNQEGWHCTPPWGIAVK